MSTLTMTPNRFGSSISGAQPNFPAMAQSMVDSLPAIDFRFNDLRDRMSQFTARFDDFIAKGRARVLEERNAFRINVAEVEDQQRNRHQAISELESKSSDHAHSLSKEAQEKEEMDNAIRALTIQKEEHLSHRDQIKAEIATVQAAIKQRRDAQMAYRRSLEAQATHNMPELRFWETCLAMRIETGGGDDRLRFIFTGLDERDARRECWLDLQLAPDFSVAATKPRLDKEDVEAMSDRLHEMRNLGPFLKGMRGLLVAAVKA